MTAELGGKMGVDLGKVMGGFSGPAKAGQDESENERPHGELLDRDVTGHNLRP